MQRHCLFLVLIVVFADLISCEIRTYNTTQIDVCDEGWTAHDQWCYKYIPDDTYTYMEAKSVCAQQSRDNNDYYDYGFNPEGLITARSQDVRDFLKTLRNTVTTRRGTNRGANIWLNGRWEYFPSLLDPPQIDQDGQSFPPGWRWQDDDGMIDDIPWMRHRSGVQEPTRGTASFTEDCLVMLLGGKWADVNCQWRYSAVCQKPTNIYHFTENGCPRSSPGTRFGGFWYKVGREFPHENGCELCTCIAKNIARCSDGYCQRNRECHTLGEWNDNEPKWLPKVPTVYTEH